MAERRIVIRSLRIIISLSASLFCLVAVVAQENQQQNDGSRQIFAEEFTRSRPKETKTPIRKPQRRYKRVLSASAGKATSATSKTGSALNVIPTSAAKLGVTIWRLRSGQASDSGARLLVQGEENGLVPERIGAETQLRVGDKVRLSIEAPREGYLYVVDRELYANGTKGEAYMIFPTSRTRGGDNRVMPGKLIDIPAQEDKPNYFTLIPTPNRQDQVGEALSIIVTSEPLENFTMTNKPIVLASDQIDKWEKQWGTRYEEFELDGGAGKTWSKEEKEASAEGTSRLLTQEEPSPQTVYLVEGTNNKGVLITVTLRYKR